MAKVLKGTHAQESKKTAKEIAKTVIAEAAGNKVEIKYKFSDNLGALEKEEGGIASSDVLFLFS